MMHPRKFAVLVLMSFAFLTSISVLAAPREIAEIKRSTPVDFEKEVLPVLRENCLACHNKTKAKADLILETPKDILKGGDSGPAAIRGKGAESLVLQLAAHEDEDSIMPPPGNKAQAKDLTPEQLGLLKLWIDQGATGEVLGAASIEWNPLPANYNPTYSMAVTRDGRRLAVGRANRIHVYHLPSGKLTARIVDSNIKEKGFNSAHLDVVHSLAFNPDGTLLASGGYREVKLWSSSRKPAKKYPTISNEGEIPLIAQSADGKTTAHLDSVKQLAITDFSTGKTTKARAFTNGITAIKFSKDHTYIGVIQSSGVISFIDRKTGKIIATEAAKAKAQKLAWAADSKSLFVSHADKKIRRWELRLSSAKSETPDAKQSNAAKPNNSDESVVRLVESKDLISLPENLTSLTSQGSQLIGASKSGTLRIWNTSDGKLARQIKHETSIDSILISGDGQRLASIAADKGAKLWNAKDGKLVAELIGNPDLSLAATTAQLDLVIAKEQVTHHQKELTASEKRLTSEKDRLKKADEAKTSKTKAHAEKEKALADLKTAHVGAQKSLAAVKAEIQKITSTYKAAETKLNEAKAKATNLIATTDKEDKTVKPSKGAIEKAVADIANAAMALGELKPEYARVSKEAEKRVKDSEAKVAAEAKKIPAAETALKKAADEMSRADNEFSLASRSVERETKNASQIKAAKAEAEAGVKLAETNVTKAKALATASNTHFATCAFSPDNSVVATITEAGLLQTWNAADGRPSRVFPTQFNSPISMRFADAKTIHIIAKDGRSELHNLQSDWNLAATLGNGTSDSPIADRVNSIAFSPDGKRLASGGGEPSRDGELILWDLQNQKPAKIFKRVHSDSVLNLAFSREGDRLASSASDKFVKITDLKTSKVLHSFEGHTHHALAVSWKRDGRTLVSGGADKAIKLWNADRGGRIKSYTSFGKEVTATTFLESTNQYVAASGDSNVRLMDEAGKTIRGYKGATGFIHTCVATPDGSIVAAGNEKGTAWVWNGADGKLIWKFEAFQ